MQLLRCIIGKYTYKTKFSVKCSINNAYIISLLVNICILKDLILNEKLHLNKYTTYLLIFVF